MEVAWNIISFQNLDKPPPKFQVPQEGKRTTPLLSIAIPEESLHNVTGFVQLFCLWVEHIDFSTDTIPNQIWKAGYRKGTVFLLHHLPWSMPSIAMNWTALVLVTRLSQCVLAPWSPACAWAVFVAGAFVDMASLFRCVLESQEDLLPGTSPLKEEAWQRRCTTGGLLQWRTPWRRWEKKQDDLHGAVKMHDH